MDMHIAVPIYDNLQARLRKLIRQLPDQFIFPVFACKLIAKQIVI